MDSEKLIELVRIHVELFDVTHPKYLDVSHREKLWQEIGRELNQTAANCRSRWNNIRDNYRKHIRKVATKYGQDTNQIKRYKYFEQLDFLRVQGRERETIGNIRYETLSQIKEEPVEIIDQHQVNEKELGEAIYNISYEQLNHLKDEPIEDVDQQENREEEYSTNVQLTENEDSNIQQQEANENIYENTAEKQTPRKRPSSSVISIPIPRRKVQLKQSKTASSVLMKYLLDKEEREEKTQQSNTVDVFLASLAPTLKKFSPYDLNIAKTKIFSIVQEYELRMIVEANAQSTTLLSPSPSLPSSSQYFYTPTPITNSSIDPLDTCVPTRDSSIPTSSVTYTTLQNLAVQQPDPLNVSELPDANLQNK